MLIPYIGNKYRTSKNIIPLIPKDMKTYVEPFGGLYGIYFGLNFNYLKDVKFIYNDINNLNSELFKNLKNPLFIQLVKNTIVDYDFYKKCLNELDNENDSLLSSLNWLVILCCSDIRNVGNDSYISNNEFEIFKLKLNAYQFHIDRINEIHNLDYKKIIDMYDSIDTFFFIDPPYFNKEDYYYNNKFGEDDHNELSIILKNIKGRFILTYHKFDGIEDMYKDFNISETITSVGVEILIKNF